MDFVLFFLYFSEVFVYKRKAVSIFLEGRLHSSCSELEYLCKFNGIVELLHNKKGVSVF